MTNYYWYTTPYTEYFGGQSYYYKGVQYVGFIDEPEPLILDRYKLRYVGAGSMDVIRSERA